MSFLAATTWRRAAKAFATEGPIPDVKDIAEAIRMAPSSFGVTPCSFGVQISPGPVCAL
jgi:nitroreductase